MPQTLEHLPDNFQFSAAELGFHNLLHVGGEESAFLTFINDLKSAGARYFIPHGFEVQIGTTFLKNQIGLISKAARLQAELLGEQDTRQSELISSLRCILRFAGDLQKIHSKTYCIAGINLVFSTEAAPEVMREHFITLPYVFVSDGMDEGIVASMKKFFLDSRDLDENPYLNVIRNVDYYARDLLDTEDTISRVLNSTRFVAADPVRQAIITESEQPMAPIQIGKFAHAEQKALDKLALLLPSFIKIINAAPHNARVIHAARIHMLVNNDSCSRCDAVIKAAIEPNGWLIRTLRAKMEEVRVYAVDPLLLNLHEGLRVSAAVSSFSPYSTGEPLEGLDASPFYSRGGTCKHVIATNRWTKEPITANGAILKCYR